MQYAYAYARPPKPFFWKSSGSGSDSSQSVPPVTSYRPIPVQGVEESEDSSAAEAASPAGYFHVNSNKSGPSGGETFTARCRRHTSHRRPAETTAAASAAAATDARGTAPSPELCSFVLRWGYHPKHGTWAAADLFGSCVLLFVGCAALRAHHQ